jgi:hypothetical protein
MDLFLRLVFAVVRLVAKLTDLSGKIGGDVHSIIDNLIANILWLIPLGLWRLFRRRTKTPPQPQAKPIIAGDRLLLEGNVTLELKSALPSQVKFYQGAVHQDEPPAKPPVKRPPFRSGFPAAFPIPFPSANSAQPLMPFESVATLRTISGSRDHVPFFVPPGSNRNTGF